MRRRAALRTSVLAVLVLLLGTHVSAAPQPGRVHFSAAGDFAQNANTAAVLEAMEVADGDLALALGDLSYGTAGGEQSWCDFVKARVGQSFPFELLSGNHESNGANGNINDFSACLPNQLPGVVGTYGRQYYVDVPAADPLVRFVMISPGLTYPDSRWSYTTGSPRYQWTAQTVDGARAAGIPWVVVGMHYPCLTVGRYRCDSSPDLFNLLLSKKVDLILSGHEHNYQRSKQLSLSSGCTAVKPPEYNPACVVDSDDDLAAGAGSVALVVGTGGQVLYEVNAADPEAGYFAETRGSNKSPTYGFLDVQATADSLRASLVPSAGGTTADAFTLTRGAAAPDQPPSASFSTSCSALQCSFDASASSDPEGPVAAYAWDFGDGSTGSGVRASHTYAAAGSYTVSLTVTDAAGTRAATTRTVTAAAPTTTTYADDQFDRTLTSGWGAAPTGGAWSVSGSVADYAVAGGAGTMRVAAGTSATASLADLSAAATDIRLSFGIDKPATGSGIYVSTQGRRVPGAGSYQATTRISSNGAVNLALTRVPASGPAVDLQTVRVPGLTHVPADLLDVRVQTTGASPTTLRAKVWKAGTPEPDEWHATATDSAAGLQTAGAVALSPYLSRSASNAPITVRVDALTVTAP